MLPDRLFYPLVALLAAGLVALALVWPQGQGAIVRKAAPWTLQRAAQTLLHPPATP